MVLYSHGFLTFRQYSFLAAMSAAGSGLYAFYLFGVAQSTLKWQPVDGRITGSILESRVSLKRNDYNRMKYRPQIKYTFNIGPHAHEGTRVYFGADDWTYTESDAQRIVDQYSVGDAVKVFVDTKNPKETVLERGQDKAAQKSAWLAAGFAIGGIILYLLGTPRTISF